MATAGPEAVALMAEAGQTLDPWQVDGLNDALGETADGNWSAETVVELEPRQNGKGTMLEAKTLHALFVVKSPLILWSAHEFKTAREGFLRLRALVDNTDAFRKKVQAVRTAAGEEGIELLGGPRVRFIARSRGSGRGFSAPDVILDEAYALTDEQLAAILFTQSAQSNPQTWYTSSAPLAVSVVLRRLMKAGRVGADPTMYFREYSADPTLDRSDPRAWAQANPGYGIRIRKAQVLKELAQVDPADFDRERLGIVDLDELADQVVKPEIWSGAADPRSGIALRVCLGIDVTPDRTKTAIGAAGLRSDDRRHWEVIEQLTGTKTAVSRVKALVARHDVACVAVDANGPGAALIPDLDRALAGTDTVLEVVGGSDITQACQAWLDHVTNDEARHLDQPPLNTALSGAKPRPMGDGGWKWSRKDSSIDISPLCAVTVADHGLSLHGMSPAEEPEPLFAFAD